jgi:hypothetical protein
VADRISKLEEITVAHGAAPSEAEFAARRARFLKEQLALGDHRLVPATINFRRTVSSPSAGSSVPTTVPPASANAPAVMAAYSARRGERRRKSALRFVEIA